MPNHITNKLTIIGNENKIEEVLEFIKIDNEKIGTIDFNKITPMPKWIFSGNLGREEEQKYGKQNCWYEWCLKNWGTKWNAYDQEFNKITNTLYFDTAWSGVPELISKLAWIFPNVKIDYSWADEDLGYNVGKCSFKDTEVWCKEIQSGSKEAYELAFDIKGIEPKEYGYVFNEEKNTYVYDEEYEG